MCAIGAGMSTASAAPRPCTRAMREAFQLSPRCVCRTAFGTPVDPEVNRTSATSEGRLGEVPAPTAGPPSERANASGSEMASAASSTTRAGSIWPSAPSISAGPNECSSGAATAPRRQQARVRTAAARLLGTCQATASPRPTPRPRNPPATVATSASMAAAPRRVSPSTTSPPWSVASASSVGTSQGPPGLR